MIGGPFFVDLSKPYKPVFIIFLDLMIAISFLSISFLYYFTYWAKQEDELTSFWDMMPRRISFYNLILFSKFVVDLAYLVVSTKNESLNRSSSTSSLYWFRILFDLTLFGGLLIAIHYVKMISIKSNGMVGGFKYSFVIMKVVFEIVVYWICVKRAFKRSVYQEFSKWKKNGPSPLKRELQDELTYLKLKSVKEYKLDKEFAMKKEQELKKRGLAD